MDDVEFSGDLHRPREGAEIARQLQLMGERLADMIEAAVNQPELSVGQARDLWQKMASALDELHVAEEELLVQADQLSASAAAVDAERERYGELFEFAPDAYLETDGVGTVLRANGGAEQLLAVPRRFLEGKLLQSFVVEDDRRDLRHLIAGLVATGEPVTLRVTVTPRDGDPVPVEVRGAAGFVGASDDEVRLRWLLRDITDRLKLEDEIRQLHADVDLLESLAAVNRWIDGLDDPVSPMLDGLMDLANRSLDGVGACVLLTGNHGTRSRAVSSDEVAAVCAAQDKSGGPGHETMRDGMRRIVTAAEMQQWPELASAMHEHGFEWMLSHPVGAGDTLAGVLVLVGRGDLATLDRDRRVERVAEHASSIIANGWLYRSASELAQNLEKALESRGVIEQAKGILMAWEGCSADRAFDILRRASQRENRKLRVIAEDIVARAVARGRTHHS